MFRSFSARPYRAAPGIAAAVLALCLSLPAMAVDTGGGGGGGSGGGGTSSGGGSGSSGSSSSSNSSPSGWGSHGGADTSMAAAPMKAKPVLVDLDAARQLIARKNWDGAIKLLRIIVVQQPRNADAQNLLGYSLRQKGEMKEAEAWYLKALKLDPRHLGANEYLGELYVMAGELVKAKARLAAIAKICGNTTCEEYGDLSRAIAGKTS